MTNRNDEVVHYVHDRLNRLTEEWWEDYDGQETYVAATYAYDKAGRMVSADNDYAEYDYVFDNLGRMNSTTSVLAGLSAITLANTFDNNNRRTHLTTSIGNTADLVNQYYYDNLNRTTRLDQHGVGGGNTVAEKRVDFGYNQVGQLTSLARYSDLDGGNTYNVGTTGYSYDSAGRMKTILHTPKTGSAITESLTYDALGRVASFTHSADGSVGNRTLYYDYDNLDRIIEVSGWQTDTYEYDANGNIVEHDNNEWFVGASGLLSYQNGVGIPFSYSFNGELISGFGSFYYDFRHRLVKARYGETEETFGPGTLAGPFEIDHTLINYEYDSFDRLVSREALRNWYLVTPIFMEEEFSHFDWELLTSEVLADQRFVYDGDDVLLQFDDHDANPATAPALSKRYLHGPAVDQILAQENLDQTYGTNYRVRWLLGDHQNTTRDVLNNAGSLDQHYTYDVYGKRLSGSTDVTTYLYTGRPIDTITGYQYHRARWYAPEMARFITRDPIGDYNTIYSGLFGHHGSYGPLSSTAFADGSNPYIYAHSSPTMGTDPSGLDTTTVGYGFCGFIPSVIFGPIGFIKVGGSIDATFGDDWSFDLTVTPSIGLGIGGGFSGGLQGTFTDLPTASDLRGYSVINELLTPVGGIGMYCPNGQLEKPRGWQISGPGPIACVSSDQGYSYSLIELLWKAVWKLGF